MRRNFLLLITSIILIISFGFSTTVSLKSLDKLIKENNRENSVIYANEVNNAVLDVFSEAVAVSKSMGNIFIRHLFTEENDLSVEEQNELINKYLSEIIYKFGYATAFLVNDKTMTYYAERNFIKTVNPLNPDDDWYVPFRESGKVYELNVDNDQANNNRLTIYINTRMLDSVGNYVGACGIGVPIKQVMDLLQSMEIQNNITIKLVAPDGIVKVGRSGQIVMKRTEEELRSLLKDYDYEKLYSYIPRGEDAYTIVKYIPECQWFAVIDYEGGKNSAFSTMLFRNLLMCLTVMLAVLIIINFVLNNFTRHTEKVVEESLVDQLTGLKNRRAYQAELEKINARGNFKDVSVATMDINGLKMTNDSFGHTVGDDLLKGAAQVMKETFVENGWKVFRTGGDEFVAITSVPVSDLTTLVSDFKTLQNFFKHDQIKELSISVGTAQGCDQTGITRVEDLIKIADKRMYTDKEIFYSDSRHERRNR